MKKKQSPKVFLKLQTAALLILCCIFGYLLGRIIDTAIAKASVPSITLAPDTRPPVATVIIEGIRDGYLEGSIIGSGTRLFLAEEQILPNASGSFLVPAGPFLVNNVTVHVPEWAQFVASKRGKKYYKVHSAAGQNIAPENRVYFRNALEAEGRSYSK